MCLITISYVECQQVLIVWLAVIVGAELGPSHLKLPDTFCSLIFFVSSTGVDCWFVVSNLLDLYFLILNHLHLLWLWSLVLHPVAMFDSSLTVKLSTKFVLMMVTDTTNVYAVPFCQLWHLPTKWANCCPISNPLLNLPPAILLWWQESEFIR